MQKAKRPTLTFRPFSFFAPLPQNTGATFELLA